MNTRTLFIRFSMMIAPLIAALAIGAPPAMAAGTTVVLDTSSPATSCGSYTGQTAVTNLTTAVSGLTSGTVVVCPGTYPAMPSTALISNANNVTIKAAVKGVAPVLTLPAATSNGIYVVNSSKVTFDGLIFDGSASGVVAFYGITYIESSGTIRNSVVIGSSISTAIYAYADGTSAQSVVISNTTLAGYSIGIEGDGAIKLTITGCTLDGSNGGLVTGSSAGIKLTGSSTIPLNPTGTISKNTIIDSGLGIHLVGASKVSIASNTLIDHMTGIIVEVNNTSPSADNTKISKNTILVADSGSTGIFVFNDSPTTQTIHNLSISGNKINSDRFRVSGGPSGIRLLLSSNIPSSVTGKLSKNIFSGFTPALFINNEYGWANVTQSGNTHTP